MTTAQWEMLKLASDGPRELGDLVMECARHAGNLAWRNSDRVAGSLLRRGWIVLTGDVASLTTLGERELHPAGRA